MKPLLLFTSFLCLGCATMGDTLTLFSTADTTISEDNGARADGGTTTMIVGHLGHLDIPVRGLLQFDLSSLPSDAVVTSVALNVTVIASAGGDAIDMHALHRMNAAWVENSASWNSSGFMFWEEAGGDFDGVADAITSVGGLGTYTFGSTPRLIDAVQMWLASPAANNGWLLRSQSEDAGRNARRFTTREAGDPVPTLTINYTVPPHVDFNVTSPGFYFAINGQSPNPTLTLTRGSNYTFAINTDLIHPFEIVSNVAGRTYTNGLSTNNLSSGTIAFAVPLDAPDTLYYICSQHFFGGTIQIVSPPPPPPPPDFTVTTPGSYYAFNDEGLNPNLTLTRGVTYTFAIDADPSHPFEIVSDPAGISWDEGVVNNNIFSGLLTFTVPADAPDTLYYICSQHFFGGEIDIIDPPPPPLLVRVLSINVNDSNVVMKSLGTNGNGWLAIPEYSSNLVVSNWAVVPGYSNFFQSGTNVTAFNRLDPICGPNVFLRMKNVQN